MNNGILKTLFGKGKNSYLFLLLSFLSILVFSVGSTFTVVDSTTYVSTSISYYEKNSGYSRVYAEAYGSRTDTNGYYHYSDYSFAFSQKAASTTYYPSIQNRYFYLGKGSTIPTYVVPAPSDKLVCAVMTPAMYGAKGSSFGFTQFGNKEITFTNDKENQNEVYISEKLAASLLGETVTEENYSKLVGQPLNHSIDGGNSFNTSHTILGVIAESSVGGYAPILGDYFIFAPYCSVYNYYHYVHMAFFFSGDRVENESSLYSCIYSETAKSAGIQIHFYNYSAESKTYSLSDLDAGIQLGLSNLPPLKNGLLIGGCILVVLAIGLEIVSLIFEKRLLKEVVKERISDSRNVLLALLFTITLLLAIVLSLFALLRFNLPPSFFLPFSPISMVSIFVFFLSELVVQSFVYHHSFDQNIDEPKSDYERPFLKTKKVVKVKTTVIEI